MTTAISAPDVCSREHARAWTVNVTGTSEFIAKMIARRGELFFLAIRSMGKEAMNLTSALPVIQQVNMRR